MARRDCRLRQSPGGGATGSLEEWIAAGWRKPDVVVVALALWK